MHEKIKTEYVDPATLQFAKYNPRFISDDAMVGLMASITEFGIVDPFVVNKRNKTIVGGHMRCRAAIEMGIKEVPIVFVDLSLEKEKALNLTLNNQNITGYFTAGLELILSDIKAGLPDLYDNLGLDDLLSELPSLDYKDTSDDEWKDMPEYIQEDLQAKYQIIVSFYTEEDIKKFAKLINQPLTTKTRSFWFPKAIIESCKNKSYTDES